MKPIFLTLILLIVTSCSSARYKSNDSLTVSIDVRQVNKSTWKVTYSLSKKSVALRFLRDINSFRKATWRPLSSNIEILHNRHGFEYIKAKDGEPFDNATFEVDAYSKLLNKDYEFTVEFSDGTHAMYPGLLRVGPVTLDKVVQLRPESNYDDHPAISYRFSFVPSKDQRLVLGDQVLNKYSYSESFDEPQDFYIYFGQIKPAIFGGQSVLLDPGMPSWVKEVLRTAPKAAFEAYSRLLEAKHSFHHFFILNFAHEGDQLKSGGGLLESDSFRTVQTTLMGQRWKTFSKQKRVSLLRVVLHEMGHSFNSNNIKDWNSIAWMQEGGTEALTAQILKEINIATQAEVNEVFKEEKNKCLEVLNSRTVIEVPKPDEDYKLAYHCGHVANVLTQKILEDESVFPFWKELLKRSKSKRSSQASFSYTKEIYFNLLIEMTKKRFKGDRLNNKIILIEDLKNWISEPQPETVMERRALIEKLVQF